MLPFPQVLFQRIQDNLYMPFVAEEIRIAYIDENSLDIVLTDIIGIGFLDLKEILVMYRLLIAAIPFLYILL